MSFNDLTRVGTISSPGNTQDYLVIEGNLAKNIPDLNCGFRSRNLVAVPYITRAIVLKAIPGFITRGDVYTITIFISSGSTRNEPLYDFYINVQITRSKTSNINASS